MERKFPKEIEKQLSDGEEILKTIVLYKDGALGGTRVYATNKRIIVIELIHHLGGIFAPDLITSKKYINYNEISRIQFKPWYHWEPLLAGWIFWSLATAFFILSAITTTSSPPWGVIIFGYVSVGLLATAISFINNIQRLELKIKGRAKPIHIAGKRKDLRKLFVVVEENRHKL